MLCLCCAEGDRERFAEPPGEPNAVCRKRPTANWLCFCNQKTAECSGHRVSIRYCQYQELSVSGTVSGTVSIRHCQYQQLPFSGTVSGTVWLRQLVSGTVSIRHCQYPALSVSGTVSIRNCQYQTLLVESTVSISCQIRNMLHRQRLFKVGYGRGGRFEEGRSLQVGTLFETLYFE